MRSKLFIFIMLSCTGHCVPSAAVDRYALPVLQTRPLNRFACTMRQTTRIDLRKGLLGISLIKNSRSCSSPKKFQSAFYIQIEKIEQVKDSRKNFETDLYQIGVKESNGDFTCGLARPVADENRQTAIINFAYN
jgi:hypothetical protein